jgi:hypothetical protein
VIRPFFFTAVLLKRTTSELARYSARKRFITPQQVLRIPTYTGNKDFIPRTYPHTYSEKRFAFSNAFTAGMQSASIHFELNLGEH